MMEVDYETERERERERGIEKDRHTDRQTATEKQRLDSMNYGSLRQKEPIKKLKNTWDVLREYMK